MFRQMILLALVALSMAVDLTPETFESLVKSGDKPALVKFYAPWCGHCKRMAPAFKQLEDALGDKVTVGDVDCTQHNSLCSEFGVRGYPTLKLFKNGQPEDYKGGRSFEDLKSQVEANLL